MTASIKIIKKERERENRGLLADASCIFDTHSCLSFLFSINNHEGSTVFQFLMYVQQMQKEHSQ